MTCRAGSYSTATGSSACTLIPAGEIFLSSLLILYCSHIYPTSISLRDTQGSFSAVVGSSLAVYTSCAAGYYAPSAGLTACAACPAGTYASSLGSTACTLCPSGSYQLSTGQSSCIVCAAGMFSAGGVDQCSIAPRIVVLNSYSACGAAFCATCGVGTWCDCHSYEEYYGGDRRLQAIDVGLQDVENELLLSDYSTEQADSVLGPAGLLHKDNPLSQTLFGSWCSACSPGTFCPGNALGYACPMGAYQGGWGCSACTLCPVGYFASTTQRSSCVAAPAGD